MGRGEEQESVSITNVNDVVTLAYIIIFIKTQRRKFQELLSWEIRTYQCPTILGHKLHEDGCSFVWFLTYLSLHPAVLICIL